MFLFGVLKASPVASFDVLYGGLGISKLQILIEKKIRKIFSTVFLLIFGIKTLDPDPDSLTPGSGSVSGPDPYPVRIQ
jgi:hypothetical protein